MKLKLIPAEERIHSCFYCGGISKYKVKLLHGLIVDVCNTCALRYYDNFIDISGKLGEKGDVKQ